MTNVILSLCDHSGVWSRPYLSRGYTVIRVDPKHCGIDHGGRGLTEGQVGVPALVRMPDGGYGLGLTAGALVALLWEHGTKALAYLLGVDEVRVHGVLMAPPCTDFSSSGARWWADKDRDGRTAQSVAIVKDCLTVVDLVRPVWWALENPVGRIAKLVPRLGAPKLIFDPCDFALLGSDPEGEAYTKRTCIWGSFNPYLPTSRVEPVMYTDGNGNRGSWMWAKLGGKSERTKALRSATPTGFSNAFALANP